MAHDMTWTGKQDDIDAVNWGWSMQNDQLIPIMSQMTAAPDSLLKIIHCMLLQCLQDIPLFLQKIRTAMQCCVQTMRTSEL